MHLTATLVLALTGICIGSSCIHCENQRDAPHAQKLDDKPRPHELKQWRLREHTLPDIRDMISNIPTLSGGREVRWDRKYNRPIREGNKVVNPFTRLLEVVSEEETYYGPPHIDFFVHNIWLSPMKNRFMGLRAALFATVDDVIAEIGAQVGKGEYEIMSINASRYSVFLLIKSDRTNKDLANGVFWGYAEQVVACVSLRNTWDQIATERKSESLKSLIREN